MHRTAITPITPAALADRVVGLVVQRPGRRVRVVLDGAPPTRPAELAAAVVASLRVQGRDALVVDAGDYLRPASVRLEHGHTDADMFLDGWLDEGGLRREVLDPAAPGRSGRVLPRLWDAARDRAHRDRYRELPADGVVVLAGALLLGRGLPVDLAVHLRMSPAALARHLPAEDHWQLAAFARYETERHPGDEADVLVLADHPHRPAMRMIEG
ncbi:uridine kinase [Pseudonocardia hispaniensis]|uniref:Uridine kinase n=1 Tax=Pseudonocardia hispaniensis TaxID=904933 RepID=A0ABW1J5L5_9PSEU